MIAGGLRNMLHCSKWLAHFVWSVYSVRLQYVDFNPFLPYRTKGEATYKFG